MKKKNAKKFYGGIAVCIKKEIRNGVKVMPRSSAEITWIRLNRSFFNLKQDIFLAFTYVSPQGSSYACKNEDIIELLEADITKYSQQGKCMVCGDFNFCKNAT